MTISFEVWPNMPGGRLEAAGPAWNSWDDKSPEWCARKVAEYGYDGVDYLFGHVLNGPKETYEDRLAATAFGFVPRRAR